MNTKVNSKSSKSKRNTNKQAAELTPEQVAEQAAKVAAEQAAAEQAAKQAAAEQAAEQDKQAGIDAMNSMYVGNKAVAWMDGQFYCVGTDASIYTQQTRSNWRKWIAEGRVRWGRSTAGYVAAAKTANNARSIAAHVRGVDAAAVAAAVTAQAS